MILDPWFWLAAFGGAGVYWRLPARWRDAFIVLLSVAYLVTISVASVAIAVTLGVLAHGLSARHDHTPRARTWVARGLIATSCLTLVFWKYGPELARTTGHGGWLAQLALPIGLSFYTFRLIHYVLERSRNKLPDDGLVAFLAYVFFLPVFTAGPIEQYEHYKANRVAAPSRDLIVVGLTRVAHGLIKKLLIADVLIHQRSAETFLKQADDLSTLAVWQFLLLTYAYAYVEFSGYSDVAIGIAQLFGVRVVENFNWPILAVNVGDFWKRWHISLAAWTQRYVYMPVMGRWRSPYAAIFCTFGAIGVWHGATSNYVAWGLFHALGVAASLYWAQLKRRRRWKLPTRGLLQYWGLPITFVFITFSFVFSSTNGLGLGAAWRLILGALALD